MTENEKHESATARQAAHLLAGRNLSTEAERKAARLAAVADAEVVVGMTLAADRLKGPAGASAATILQAAQLLEALGEQEDINRASRKRGGS